MTTSASSSRATALTALTVLLLAALGLFCLWQVTLGWRVVATEDGRRLMIREQPLALPVTPLTPQTELLDTLRRDGRVAIVTFFYSRCNAVCSSLGSQYQQLQSAIAARGMERQVRLLSISFDARDDGLALRHYASLQHADGRIWQLAGIADPGARRRLLDAFGIVVLPAPLGEFQHNAAFHVVDRHGRLVRIFDLEEADAALGYALALAQQAPP